MNLLSNEIRRSLKELDLGLKGELTITNDMENLGNCLFFDQVPPSWTKRAYASLHGLANWYVKKDFNGSNNYFFSLKKISRFLNSP